MGSAWSRKPAAIDASFQAAPRDVASWDLQHVKILHHKFRDGGYEFGLDRVTLRDLITSALPTARALTGDFWDAFVEHEQEMLYPLELFAAIAFQCHGLSRDKALFCFDMFDFEGREEASYDEVAICISTVVGALSKVSGSCRLLDEASVDKLADDCYVVAGSDACAPLSKANFVKWVEKGLHIDLSAAVTIEEVGRALGLWSDEEQERQHQQQVEQQQQQQEQDQQQEQQQREDKQPGQELGVGTAENEATTDGQRYVGGYAEETTIERRDDDDTGAGGTAS